MAEGTVKEKLDFISSWPPEDSTSTADPVVEHQSMETLVQSTLSHNDGTQAVITHPNRVIENKGTEEKPGVGERKSYADACIARWWRHHGKTAAAMEGLELPPTRNPQTLIQCIIRTDLGQSFMKGEVQQLLNEEKQGVTNGDHAKRAAVLSTFLEKQQKYTEAEEYIEKAIYHTLDANDVKEYKWIRERLKRRSHMTEERRKIQQTSETPREWPRYRKVERRSARCLTTEEFFTDYALKSRPLVITDLVATMTTVPWTLQHIRDVAGNCPVTLKKLDPQSTEWARLENSGQTTVSEFIDSLEKQQDLPVTEKTYLFDWSLPLHCPRLAEELIIPKYFANDFLQRTSAGSLYQDSWPSLFVAPPGVRSELHVDAFGSNFWMALFVGKKRWVFFEQSDTALLYPSYSQSLDPVFEVDLNEPDFSLHPLLAHTSPLECMLQPGELLFVPAGCPHRVENLEKSLAISANFVDASNHELVVNELSVNGLLDHGSHHLVEQLTSEWFNTSMDFGVPHTRFSDLKKTGKESKLNLT